jgi:short subunit fatty acids transporter
MGLDKLLNETANPGEQNMQPQTRNIMIVIVILALVFLTYGIMTMPDNRNPSEKIGDAIHDLPQGVDKASRQLEDRTPGQRLGDTIKDNTNPPRENAPSQ